MEATVTASKRFYHQLLSAVHLPTIDAVNDLEAAWKLQRPKFINLLKHADKSISDRQEVQNSSSATAVTSGVRHGYDVFQQQYVDEALILSDVFDLNEIEALKLVIAGDCERPNHPDWPRGLCAVYLFYKNRWYQAQTLKLLIRHRNGRYWRHEMPASAASEAFNQLQQLVQTITDQLWRDNLLATLLGLLQSPTDAIQMEFEKLQQPKVKGLGGPRHRKMIAECCRETYTALGDSLYYWCCQTPLEPQDFSTLVKFTSGLDDKMALFPVTFSILQAIDASILESSDSQEDISKYAPFATDTTTLMAYYADIVGGRKWIDVGAQAVVQLAWAVSLRMIAKHHMTQNTLDDETLGQDEEDILSDALMLASVDTSLPRKDGDIRGPFHWIRRHILNTPEFLDEQLYARRLHSLITELIHCFPSKLKEWRSEADEECRQMAEVTTTGTIMDTAPSLHFEQLMLMIGEFYGTPPHSQLALAEVYFYPHEASTPSRRVSQAQMALFLRTSGAMLPSRLYIAYLRMMAGLASSPPSARLCFEMLKAFGTYGASLSSVSIDNFFAALDRYLRVLKSFQQSVPAAAPTSPLILPDEMKGLQTWFDLISSMAEQDASVRLALFEHPRWSCPANTLGLLTCAVPLELKAHALRCLEALAESPELALALSEGLLVSGVVSPVSGTKLGGVRQELEEVESRLETYPVTTGLVKFLAALCQHKTFVPDGTTMIPYVDFVLNSVLVHVMNRNYQNPSELWNLSAAVLRFIYNVVENYEPTVASIVGQSLGCQVMVSLMNDGPVFRTVCRICITSIQWMDEYKEQEETNKAVLDASLYSLKVLYAVLSKQDAFNVSVIESGVSFLATSMDVLLQMLNPQTNEADYVVNLAMILNHYRQLPEHCLYAVRIIDALNASVTNQTKLVKYISSDAAAMRILHAFVTCLSLDDVDASLELSDMERGTVSESKIRAHTALAVLELLISDAKRRSPSASLSSVLVRFDSHRLGEHKFENAGINNTPRTCLHAVLDIVEASLGQYLPALSFGALVEPAYRLLFWFAASPKTGEATLRYLRTEYDFFRKHIEQLKLPELKQVGDGAVSRGDLAIGEVAGWILKLCALELASVSTSQPTYATAISELLLAVDSNEGYSSLDVISTANLSMASARSGRRKAGRERKACKSRRLFEFLATFNAVASGDVEEAVVVPRLLHFEGVRLSKLVAACTTKTAKDYYTCDVGRLCDVLEQELLALQGTVVVGQLHLLRNEIQTVVDTLIKYNGLQYSAYVLRHGYAGFSQVAQLLFSVCPFDWSESEQLDQAIIETMIEALRSNTSVVADEMAGLILSLTTTLRRRFRIGVSLEERSLDTTRISTKHATGLLDGSVARAGQKASLSCAGILATALKLLIEAILKPENRRTNIKTNLYGALMNFFRLWQKPAESGLSEGDGKSFEPTIQERMAEEHWVILSRYVVDLVEILARDAADGFTVTKTVAMCCLLTLLEQDAVHGGAGRKAFVNRGYANAIRFPPQFQKWVTVLTT